MRQGQAQGLWPQDTESADRRRMVADEERNEQLRRITASRALAGRAAELFIDLVKKLLMLLFVVKL